MRYPNFLGAVPALALGVTAVPASSSHALVGKQAPSCQAPSDLQNASTYHALTRVRNSAGRSHSRRLGKRSFYGFSGTTSFGNVQGFYTPVQFGSQTFDLLIDTGSSDTWVLAEGAQCIDPTTNEPTTGPICDFGPEWDASGCAAVPNQNFNIDYGGVYVDQGKFCTIDVTLAGITARNQQVAVVTTAAVFGYAPSSGVLGLAYPALTYGFHGTNFSADDRATNQAPYNPLFTTMVNQSAALLPLFSIALSRPSTHRTNDGYIALGGLAPVLTIGEWATTPIQKVTTDQPGGYLATTLPGIQYEWYTFTPDAFLYQMNNEPWPIPADWIALPMQSGNLSFENQYIIDSGYTDFALPPILSDAIASKFSPPGIYNSDTGGYAVPCNATAPWFAIKIGGVIFPIDKRDMVISDQSGLGTCMTGTTNSGAYAPYAIGDVFMTNVEVVFDVGVGVLNFASRGKY